MISLKRSKRKSELQFKWIQDHKNLTWTATFKKGVTGTVTAWSSGGWFEIGKREMDFESDAKSAVMAMFDMEKFYLKHKDEVIFDPEQQGA